MVTRDYLARKYLRAAVINHDDEESHSVSRVIPKSATKLKMGSVDIGYYHDPKSTHKKRSRNSFDMGLARLREIEAIISHMFARGFIPDPSGTDDWDSCVAFIRQAALAMTDQDMTAWCRKWAPWADADLIARIEREAEHRARWTDKSTRGDVCGRELGLTWAMRCELGIKTITAAGMTAKESRDAAKQRKNEKDRTRQERKRRAAGVQDRESYLANTLTRQEPWLAFGISRRTWERRGKPMPVAGVSRVPIKDKNGYTLATAVEEAPQAAEPAGGQLSSSSGSW